MLSDVRIIPDESISKAMADKIYLPLENVDNAHCAHIVEKGLATLTTLKSFQVELNNARAGIEPVPGSTGLADAVKKIRSLGYNVSTLKKSWPVLQMSCASCAVSVQDILLAQPGVISASVNYANAQVQIEYVLNAVSPSELQLAVQDMGYDLIISDQDTSETLEEIQLQKFVSLKLRTLGAALLTLPVVIIGMFFMDMPYGNYIMWVFSTPVILFFGRQFFINAWKQTRHRSANMDTLVALSTGVAYIFSVFNTLFSDFWHTRGIHAHVYFEAGAVVITFILLGKLLEEKAKGNTSAALKKLMGLQVKTVFLVEQNGDLKETGIEFIQKGDIVQVKPGDKIPVDGTVVQGTTYVDESMLSGEPVPVLKQQPDLVYSGTLNQKGSIQIRAEKLGHETLLAHIIQMVQDAQASKAPVQKQVDKIASVFVPIVILIACISFILWNVWGGENGFTRGLLAMVTVLVIACPCALGLATPTAIMVGIGKGASMGILIRDAESLESAMKMNALILDKTGTITEGKPIVTDEHWMNSSVQHRSILVAMEKQSEHPLADSIVHYYPDAAALEISGFESITGKGISAEYAGIKYFAGKKSLLTENNIFLDPDFLQISERWEQENKTLIWFADQHQALAVFAISDTIKTGSAAAIQQIQKSGIDVFMLTGDNYASASAVAKQTGIQHFQADVLPQQKTEFVKKLQAEGKIVGMAGDGINDSAALAQADVSIAMGKGSDIAKETAKMTIISSDLSKIPAAIRLSRNTVHTIRLNLFWAFIYNIIGIPLAAGILYPFNGFQLDPMIAGAAMALSSVSVVGNSLRLKWMRM